MLFMANPYDCLSHIENIIFYFKEDLPMWVPGDVLFSSSCVIFCPLLLPTSNISRGLKPAEILLIS